MKALKHLFLAMIGTLMVGSLAFAGAGAASAATTTPVISSAQYFLAQSDSGPYELVKESGYSFTPGGNVYTDFQDLTSDPSLSKPFGGATVKADSTGKISFSRFVGLGTAHRCHWLRAWSYDYGKAQWVTRDFFASAPGC